ncbi:MAG: 2-oxo acid dehydrogenase subunit E2 [Anaerolineales bacterium]|nr:2-oxo acid dehydrogenase subunit E2 [Anaerolineales bacterium]
MAEIITMPKLGFDMAEGTLIRWVKAENDTFNKGDVLAEIETDKATVEVEAQFNAVLIKQLIPEGTIVPVGTPIAAAGEAGETYTPDNLPEAIPETAIEPSSEPAAPATPSPPPTGKTELAAGEQFPAGIKASPLARRLAEEQRVNLQQIRGSGPGGRIVKKDIETELNMRKEAGTTPSVSWQQGLEAERIPLTRLREAIGRRMTASKRDLPHFYLTIDLDAGSLMELRSELNALMPEGVKLSVNDFLIKAAALTLLEFPNLNASLKGETILRHGEINIGIAVALDEGLLTVVNHNTDQKPLRLISTEIKQAAARAREGKVRPEEVEGSTFTISNLGMFDIDSFTAIINPPEAAILAVGSIREVPVFKDGVVVPAQRMKVTLSADHRVTDGAEAARWLQIFRSYIEQPLRLLV